MSQRRSVVVVDAGDPERLATHVASRGFETVAVESLDAARDARDADREIVDWVVCTDRLDATVPEVVAAMATPSTPVVFVYEDEVNAAAALDAGAEATVPRGPPEGAWGTHLAATVDRVGDGVERRRDHLLARAVEAFPDPCFVVRVGGTVRGWNDRLTEVTGLDDETVALSRPTDLFSESDADRVESAFGRAAMDGEASLVADLLAADGEPVPHEVTLSLVEADGERAMVGVARDVRVRRYRETELERQSAQLNALYGITSMVHDVMEVLLAAESREAMLDAVCERLTAPNAYRFAWVGSYDADSGRVEPKAWAGSGAAYLDERPNEDGGVTALTAIREERAVFVDDVAADADADGWRNAALEHGHRAAAAIPITYENAMYGCLCLYGRDGDRFDELERTILGDLGTVIGHAIHAVETRRALAADTVTELQFRVTDPESFLVQVAEGVEAELTLVGSAGRADGAIVQLFEVSGVSPDRVREFASQAPVPAEVVTEGDDECVIKVTQREYSVAHVLAEVGGSVREIAVTDGEVTMCVDAPRSANAGDVLDRVREVLEVEFLSRREVDRETWTDVDYRAAADRQLTDRQREVLETAFRAGFFDWPRERTGEEVADLLDVSPPTFHQHLRIGERKLLEVLFDRGPAAEHARRREDDEVNADNGPRSDESELEDKSDAS